MIQKLTSLRSDETDFGSVVGNYCLQREKVMVWDLKGMEIFFFFENRAMIVEISLDTNLTTLHV